MAIRDYEYYGLIAASWDLLRGDVSRWADRSFYRELIEKYGQPALDIGCATGRLVNDYCQQGLDVDGVDLSPDMLAIARRKAAAAGVSPHFYQQAMEELILPRRYRTIFVASSSFQLLLQPGQAQSAMQRFYHQLEPGGALGMTFMIIWQPGDPLLQDWSLLQEAVREDDASVRLWSWSRYEPEIRLEHTQDRYEVLRDGVVVESELHSQSPATTWYTQDEAVTLFRQSGFDDIQVYKEWSDEPAGPGDTLFSVVGVKRGV